MTRLRTLLGIGLGLAIVAGAGWYISQPGSAPPAARQSGGGRFGAGMAVPVGLATAAKGDVPIIVRALGTVNPLATVTVRSQISGQLVQVNFTEGQEVKKGDLLAVVDPRPYDVALKQAEGTLEKDQALLANARVDLERYKKLVAQDSIARQQYDTQAALVRQYEATVITDQALVDAAKLNLVYTRIVAPNDGRIGLRLVDQGNYVTVGDSTGICVLTQMKPISVLFTIPEDTLPAVRTRLKAGATLEARVLDRAQKTEYAVGKLSTTDNQVDVATGTVKLRAIFDNTDESLFPNQFVNVRLLVDTVKDAIVVPVAAVQRGQPGTFVYLVKPDDTVEVRVVELGATDGEKVAILKGLQLGDQVVVDGVDRLRDGAKIRRPTRAAAGPPIANAPPDAPAPGVAAQGQGQQGQGQQGQGQQGQGQQGQRRNQAPGGPGAPGGAAAAQPAPAQANR
jgi:multidrug efflux system membrane fusion protein